jgi:hypothetical protein
VARGKKRSKGTSGSGSGLSRDYWFINVQLGKDDKEQLQNSDLTTEFPLSSILALADEGYKFSIKKDEHNQTYVASLSDSRDGSDTFGGILTGRGATGLNAWYALAYRHFVILESDWANADERNTISDFD